MTRNPNFRFRPKYPAIFIVNDVGDSAHPLLPQIDKKVSFDMVSCQMSMHYLMESEARMRQFLTNVTERLEPGGFLIGTTLDSESMIKKLRTTGMESEPKYTFGNQFYSVRFFQTQFPEDKQFGQKYLFYLEDGVGYKRSDDKIEYVPEYLVNFEYFKKLASEYGLKLRAKKNLLKLYADAMEDEKNRELFKRIVKEDVMKQAENDGTLHDQWEISGNYLAFSFEKVEKNPSSTNRRNRGNCGRGRDKQIMFIKTDTEKDHLKTKHIEQ